MSTLAKTASLLKNIKKIKNDIAQKVVKPALAKEIKQALAPVAPSLPVATIKKTISNNRTDNSIEIEGKKKPFSMRYFRYTRLSNKQGVGIKTLDGKQSFPILADRKRPHTTIRKNGRSTPTNYKAFVIKSKSNQIFKAEYSSSKYKKKFVKIKRKNDVIMRSVKIPVLTKLNYAHSAQVYRRNPDIKKNIINLYSKELSKRITL